MTRFVVAVGAMPGEPELVAALASATRGQSTVRRCVDALDALRSIRESGPAVVILSDVTLRITPEVIASLAASGSRVVMTTDDSRPWSSLPAVHVVGRSGHTMSELAAAILHSLSDEPGETLLPTAATGALIAVAGFGGGAGTTTCVRELACAVSGRNSRVLVADADVYGPSLQQILAVAPRDVGILSACRAAESGSLVVENHCISTPTGFAVLGGLPGPSRWIDLRSRALKSLWTQCRAEFNITVVDVGAVVDWDRLPRDGSPRRHAALMTAVEQAQSVVLCARADHVGLARLIRGLTEATALVEAVGVEVVVTGVLDKAHMKDVVHAVTRHTAVSRVHCVPSLPALFGRVQATGASASSLDATVGSVFSTLAASLVPREHTSSSPGVQAVEAYLNGAALRST